MNNNAAGLSPGGAAVGPLKLTPCRPYLFDELTSQGFEHAGFSALGPIYYKRILVGKRFTA